MTKRLALALAALVLITTTSFGADLPPGKWWRKPEIVQSIGLSEEQQSRLETIFRQSANDLIDLRAEVDKGTIALRGELDHPSLDRNRVIAAARRLNEARAKLFERELILLVDMRGVLTEVQWSRMRAELNDFQTPLRQQLQQKRMERQQQRRP